jgi:hypothetical protein
MFGHAKNSCTFAAKFQTAQTWCTANSTEASRLSMAWRHSQASNPRPTARHLATNSDEDTLIETILDDALDAYAFDASDF